MDNVPNIDFFKKTLEQLDKWRHIPSYKLENRVDVFFGMFLGEALNDLKYGCDKDVVIIPEFPLLKRILPLNPPPAKTNNESVKVDFVALSKDTAYLVELKTDMKSVTEDQIKYLEAANDPTCSFEAIVNGIMSAAKNPNSMPKYAHLISQMDDAGILDVPESFYEKFDHAKRNENGNKSMKGIKSYFRENDDEREKGGEFISYKSGNRERKICIVYVAPREPDHRVFHSKVFKCITFPEFGNAIGKQPDSAGEVFAKYLKEWVGRAGEANLRRSPYKG